MRQQPLGALDRVVDQRSGVRREGDREFRVAVFTARPGVCRAQVIELGDDKRSVLVAAQFAVEVRVIDPLHESQHAQRVPAQRFRRFPGGQLLQRKSTRRLEQPIAR